MNTATKIITGILFFLTAATVSAQEFPTVTTGDASDREATSAVLNGSVSLTEEVPFGQFYFQYGRTTSYGSQTARRSVSDDRSFSQPIQGLNEETGYNFRAVLLGSNGVSYFGSNKTFVTTTEVEENNNIPGPFESTTGNATNTSGSGSTGTSNQGSNSGSGATTAAGPQVIDIAACTDPDGDCDGDGFPNELECGPGEQCIDTDGDTIPDWQDPNSHDPVIRDNDIPGLRQTLEARNQQLQEQEDAAGGGIVGVGGFNFTQPTTTTPPPAPNTDTEDVVNGGIVPCGNTADPSDACKFQDVIEIIQNIINFIVVASIFVGVALIVYGGILYMRDGGSSGNVSKAKGIFMNVAIGYFFVLCAWLIVNFIVSPQSEGGSGLINDDFQAELDSNNLDLLQDN